MQHWAVSWNPHTNSTEFQEQTAQRVDYYYDSNPINGSYSQYAQGRLAAVTFTDESTRFGVNYQYSYNQAGRVTSQHMDYDGGAHVFDASYTWDNEGRMTGTNYGPQYSLQYDVNGRLSGMLDAANGNATVATASYGVAGEMLGLSYFGYSETRTYNNLLQMTRQTVSGMMDMQYVYQAGANNGRITQVDRRDRERDGELYVRPVESPVDGQCDERELGAGVHVRRVRESDGEERDAGERADAERVVRPGDEPSDGAELRCEWESVRVPGTYRCGESDDRADGPRRRTGTIMRGSGFRRSRALRRRSTSTGSAGRSWRRRRARARDARSHTTCTSAGSW